MDFNFDDIRKEADLGDASAQFNLGNAYASGTGVAKDQSEAVSWWRKSAEQGDDDAQFSLGNAYYFGNGVAEDLEEALQWFLLAGERGDADAQEWFQILTQ